MFSYIAGLDEAGRGALAGTVVAAAVILPHGYYNPAIKDSKQLTPQERACVSEIVKVDALDWAVAMSDNVRIDELNILKASINAMHDSVSKLRIRPAHLLVDGNRFFPYPDIPHTCIVKGDTKVQSIAAASILAKTFRDAYMQYLHECYPYYGWQTNKGYPTKVHAEGIRDKGLSPVHRKTFSYIKILKKYCCR